MPDTLADLASRDPATLTRSERAVLAKRASSAQSNGGVGGEPCPDPFDPSATQALYAAWFRRSWAQAHDPTLTNIDVNAGFQSARMAAAVGKEAPPAESFSLDMASMLGKPAELVCPSCGNVVPDGPGDVGPKPTDVRSPDDAK